MNIGTQIMNTTASIGQAQSMINAIIGTIVAIIFLIISYFLFSQNQDNLVDSVGTVTSARCNQRSINNTTTYNCKLGIAHNVNTKPYNANIITNDNVPYYSQSAINITYDKTNPSNVTILQPRSKTMGFVFAGMSILLVIGVWTNFYFSQTSPAFASTQGVNSLLNMTTNRPVMF